MTGLHRQVTDDEWIDAELVWEYHQLHNVLQPCSAAVALGCNDLGVATYAAELHHRGLFPVIVFSGATSRDTWDIFPRGEAVHYRDHAMELGVPADAILVEPSATNTGDNITLSRKVFDATGLKINSLLLVSMPYMERRAFATCRQAWPEVKPICASAPLTLDKYVKVMGNSALVIDMMVGDLQRIMEYPKRGFAIEQELPKRVHLAYERLRRAGFTSRLLST